MNSILFGIKPEDKNCSFIYWIPNVTLKRQLYRMQAIKGNIRYRQGSTSRNGIKKGSYVYSKKFGNCWIQGFRSKNNNVFLINNEKKNIGESVEHKLDLKYRTSILFSIS